MAKIYVASSWRNDYQQDIVRVLRDAGHEVYDFKNPPNGSGFSWEQIDKYWQAWDMQQYMKSLDHPLAEAGYKSDYDAMVWADTFVLVLPCGRSAHLELGWACGQGKRTMIFHPEMCEPELMTKMVDFQTDEIERMLEWITIKT